MATPNAMLTNPLIRRERLSISLMLRIILRIAPGLRNGNMPSITNTNARAANRLCHIVIIQFAATAHPCTCGIMYILYTKKMPGVYRPADVSTDLFSYK